MRNVRQFVRQLGFRENISFVGLATKGRNVKIWNRDFLNPYLR